MKNPCKRARIAFAGALLSATIAYGGIGEKKCESEGIQKIIELMRSSKFEVMRVYIPDVESLGKCQWIEIGRGEYGGGAEEAIVNVDREYFGKLMAQHHRLHLYHFHPLVYFEKCAEETSCGEHSVPIAADTLSEKGLISNLRYSMPSPIDIAFMMDISRIFNQHHHEGGRIRNRVVTPYGIVEYSLTEKGKNRLEKEGMEGEAGRFGFDTYIKTRVSYALSDVDAIITKEPNDIIGALKEFARSLNNEYLLVTYTPF